MKEDRLNIPMDKIRESGLNPRKDMSEKALTELSNSIKEKGVIEPIIVRPRGEGSAITHFEIVCGERRFRASKIAKLTTIPAIVRDYNDDEVLKIMTIENIQREDLNPMEEALAIHILLGKGDPTKIMKDLALQLGKNENYIKGRIGLLSLDKEMQDAIRSGMMSAGHGAVLLRLGDPVERRELWRSIMSQRLSIKAAELELKQCGERFEGVKFDKAECLKCKFNGQSQEDLFNKDPGLKGRCLNSICFKNKENSYMQNQIDKLKKEGLKVIAENSLDKIDPHYKRESIEDYQFEKKTFKTYFEKHCKKCQDLAYVYGERKIKIYCMQKRCLNKILYGEHTTEAQKGFSMDRVKKENRVKETRRRFWIEKVMKSNNEQGSLAMVVNKMLHEIHNSQQISKMTGFKLEGWCNWNARKCYELGTKKLQEILNRILVDITPDLPDEDLEFLAQEVKADLNSQFIIDETYLNRHTKDNLVKLAKEIGLDKFLAGKKLSMDGLKKPGIVDCFLKKGFDLKGKVPAEICKAKKKK